MLYVPIQRKLLITFRCITIMVIVSLLKKVLLETLTKPVVVAHTCVRRQRKVDL